MNYSFFIAKKVAAEGEQSFARVIIRIAVIAIALSITVMICATALVSGFKREISSKIFGFWGHIHITNASVYENLLEESWLDKNQAFYPHLDTITRVSYVENQKILGREVKRVKHTNGGVRHIQVYAFKGGIIKAKDEIEGIFLKGVGKDFDWQFLSQYLVEGRAIQMEDTVASNEILISRTTSNRLKVAVGDVFIVHFVQNGEQLKRSFKICGIYKTGLEEYDRQFALVDIRKIQQLLGWKEDQVAGFEVFLDDINDLKPLSEDIYYNHIPNELYAETIRQKFPGIFNWLDLQNINEVVILSLMVIVAIINMITALMILIFERTNMIGVLKSMGARNWGIRRIFLYYAAYIILNGLLWGNILGVSLCMLQKYFKLIRLDEENYYLSYAPIYLNPWTILALNVGTLLVTLLFLIIPSYLVSRINPVKAIRFD
ncbi:MAG TPA: ABC transporter permease [Haliscomenobacter sp.]|uniref:ABC transporter permease n=1 Tax=Haliscomenobacter sp. TaxID=2717303 RepID=UPI002BCCB69B|nr:FtsX-like permease family protein [Haliscomenobacter sp.]HOY19717.1 ABC transporter permease [Haliscomenobacter sp.]HPH20282.1 ABC transporter permease [Haliscomenobacter sp.]